MCKISNEQRAHDLALLAVQVELTNTRINKCDSDHPFDLYKIYHEAYLLSKKAVDRDFQ